MKRYSMFLQQRFQFVWPAYPFVMLFLIFYVPDQPIFIIDVMGERSITFLPPLKTGKQLLLFNPSMACQFNILNNRRQWN